MVKERKVVVTLELLTDVDLDVLKSPKTYQRFGVGLGIWNVSQVQVNVVKDQPKPKRKVRAIPVMANRRKKVKIIEGMDIFLE